MFFAAKRKSPTFRLTLFDSCGKRMMPLLRPAAKYRVADPDAAARESKATRQSSLAVAVSRNALRSFPANSGPTKNAT